ncbi:hypothetical protein WNY63_17775 [Pseudoalteromonas neustonica]|uniref:Helix-turn-helix transcriptional regulator n=1 Tax=Pseudoalteromonas neustonica TaxID=1840331 RepID=A0ABU9U6A6_9GAMM
MNDRNKILFPEQVSNKHPNSKEIIELAESDGITLTEIGNIMGHSQPYISQLKSGKGKAKVSDLEPLIYRLSAKLPGQSFCTYKVFKEASPQFEGDWEEQSLLAALKTESEKSELGRYPTGDDGFDFVLKEHLKSIDSMESKKNIFRSRASIEDIINQVEEALDSYFAEENALNKKNKEFEANLEKSVLEVLERMNHRYDERDQITIEERLNLVFERAYLPSVPPANMDVYYSKKTLIEACENAFHHLTLPNLTRNLSKFENTDEADLNLLNAPDKHAKRILEKLKEKQIIINEEKADTRNKYRLNKRFDKKSWKKITESKIEDPRLALPWNELSTQLFGGTVCEVYRSSQNSAYEINLTDAFKTWSNDINYQINEEEVQICGPVLLTTQIEKSKIIIHELHTNKFILIHTLMSEKFNKEITLLSKPLETTELLEQLNLESELSGWSEDITPIIDELRNTLTLKGYRVPGVRSIY